MAEMTPDEWRALRNNAAEFATDDGRRFAWSESNVRYEEVPPDGGSFSLLRRRLDLWAAVIGLRTERVIATGRQITIVFKDKAAALKAAEYINSYGRTEPDHAQKAGRADQGS